MAEPLADALLRVGHELTFEADRWSGGRRRLLLDVGQKLVTVKRRGWETPQELRVAEQFLQAGINLAAEAMTLRGFRSEVPRG